MRHVDLDQLRRQYGTFEAPAEEPLDEPLPTAPADEQVVLADCHRVLSERQVTVAELRRKLAARHDAAVVERAIDRCAAAGLLDDARYAARYVESRIGRGQGPHRIRRDLLRRGIDRQLVDEEIARHEQESSIEDAALVAARRKFAHVDLREQSQAARLLRWCAARGYEQGSSWTVLERLRQEQAAGES